MFLFSRKTFVFLWNKKACRPAGQDNIKTCRLVQQEDMPSS